MADEHEIQSHWQKNPVGENLVGSLGEDFLDDHANFFDAYDKWYYGGQEHVLKALDKFDWRDKRVLEIGLGQGSDAEQLIRRGADWSGVDLTAESIRRVGERLRLRGLHYRKLVQGSATALPFNNGDFDIVFSHGVLHHVPDILSAQTQIRRVLKEDGRLIIMMYARWSLNYQVAIKFVRRLGLMVLYVLPIDFSGIYAAHKRNAQRVGLVNYLKIKNFIHRATDGPDNPYAKVYDRSTLQRDFPDFELVRTFKRYMHAPPLPIHGLPGESVFGWHLWAELKPRHDG